MLFPGSKRQCSTSKVALGVVLAALFFVVVQVLAAEKPQHKGAKLEGYAVGVTSDSLTVFDKKGEQFKILTSKDYTSIVGLGAEITLWYTNEGGVYHLEDVQVPNESFFVPTNQVRAGIKRIIILPKPEDVENTTGLFAAIGKYLEDSAGWFVSPPELGEEIAQRAETSAASLEGIDSETGQVDMQRLLDSQSSVLKKIAQETRVDAILEVKVEKVKARVRSSVASWDDMAETVGSSKTRALSKLTITGGRGWVYAATVDMNLWSREGKLLWKKRRGFAALGEQIGMGSKYRERPLTEVYQNPEAMQNWLSTTLGELVPSSGTITPFVPASGESDSQKRAEQ